MHEMMPLKYDECLDSLIKSATIRLIPAHWRWLANMKRA